jgi:hypothetical protein
MSDPRAKIVIYDIESYPNYFFIGTREYERESPDSEYEEVPQSSYVWRIGDEDLFKKYCEDTKDSLWVAFNNRGYDDLMIIRYLNPNPITGNTDQIMRQLSDYIISDKKVFELPQKVAPKDLFYVSGGNVRMANRVLQEQWQPKVCDLMLLSGKGSLKMKAIVLGADSIMESPHSFNKELSDDDKKDVEEYCFKDLDQTFILYKHLEADLKVRDYFYETMSDIAYSVNSPKLADLYFEQHTKEFPVLKKKYFGKNIRLPELCANKSIAFKNPDLAKWWRAFKRTNVWIPNEQGEAKMTLSDSEVSSIEVNGKENHLITFGLGGLHSTNKNATWVREEDEEMYEIDCTSMYPTSVVNYKIAPAHIPDYWELVDELVENRNKYKELSQQDKSNKDYPVMSNAFKLINNSIFGKLKDRYSYVFDTKAMLTVTITNQVLLVKLIDMLLDCGANYDLIQVNTDAVVIKHKSVDSQIINKTIKEWEELSMHTMGRTDYDALYQESVNNYFALYRGSKDKYKSKGSFVLSPRIDQKIPTSKIVRYAAIQYCINGIDPEDTIKSSKNIQDFIMSVNSTDFEYKSTGEHLGYKAIRVVYSESGDEILALKNDNISGGYKKSIVLEGERLKFIIKLSDNPVEKADINYDRYIYEAWSLIYKLIRPKYDNDNNYFVPKKSEMINWQSVKMGIETFWLSDKRYIAMWYDYLTQTLGLNVIPKNLCKMNYVGVRTKDESTWNRIDPHNALGLGIRCDNVCSIDIDNPSQLDPVLKEILETYPTMKIWHGEDNILNGGKGSFIFYTDGSEKLKSSSSMVANLGFEFLNDDGKVQTVMGVHPKTELYQCDGVPIKLPQELVEYLMNCKSSEGKRAIPRIVGGRNRRSDKSGYIPNKGFKKYKFNMDHVISELSKNDITVTITKPTDCEDAFQMWDNQDHWFVCRIDSMKGTYSFSSNQSNFLSILNSINV